MAGVLEILNVGAGDVVITFDNKNPMEAIRAKRIIKDMLSRGYALMIKLEDGTYTRAKAFDEATGEYIIADFDPDADEDDSPRAGLDDGPPIKARRGRPRGKRVGMENATATAIGRSAGG